MQIDDEVLQATLLLSCYFNKNEVKHIKPLTPVEYARFASWLHQRQLTPADLLHDQSGGLEKWQDPKRKITAERINSLLSRGASMGFALEHWAKHGLWVVSRANVMYPKKLREKLGDIRPPIFFGVGNQALLNKEGIGFVGSRTINSDDEAFAKANAELAMTQGYTIISGGAKGIDQTAMHAALACGGESVGIVADSLLRASTAKAYRTGLKENRLALISPFYPEAGFNTGNAMARNKYIYAISKAVVVVRSDFNKGGTWTGAKENLSKRWVPLLVRDTELEGNQELIKLGGVAINESFDDFRQLPTLAIDPRQSNLSALEDVGSLKTGDMFSSAELESNAVGKVISIVSDVVSSNSLTSEALEGDAAGTNADKRSLKELNKEAQERDDFPSDEAQLGQEGNKGKVDIAEIKQSISVFKDYGKIFNLFYENLLDFRHNGKEIKSAILLEQYPELTKALIEKWLKLLESEGYLKKDGRKLIYKLTDKSFNKA